MVARVDACRRCRLGVTPSGVYTLAARGGEHPHQLPTAPSARLGSIVVELMSFRPFT